MPDFPSESFGATLRTSNRRRHCNRATNLGRHTPALSVAALGADVAAIARRRGQTPRTVRPWVVAFRSGGIEALADAPIPGRRPEADAAYLAAQARAIEAAPRLLDLSFDV